MYLPLRPVPGSDLTGEVDLWTQVFIKEEQWCNYSEVQYTAQDFKPVATSDMTKVGGSNGSTKMDNLWGESIPSVLPSGGSWQQPQDLNISPDNTIYKSGFPIRMRTNRGKVNKMLNRFGQDPIYDLTATCLTSTLDKFGITCTAGDRFIFGSEAFEVVKYEPDEYFYQTNYPLVVTLYCQTARRGS